MIMLYLLAALAALVAYVVTARLRHLTRLSIALLVFVVPSATITVLVLAVGDKAPADAVTVRSL